MKYAAIVACVLLAGCATDETGISPSRQAKLDTYVKPAFAKVMHCGDRFEARYGNTKRDAYSLTLALKSYCSRELYEDRKAAEIYFNQSPLMGSNETTYTTTVDKWTNRVVGNVIQRNLS